MVSNRRGREIFRKVVKISRKTILLFSVFLLALMSTGCSKKTTTTTAEKIITVWGFDDPDVFKSIIRDFEKKYSSGYKIKYVQKSLDSGYELLSLNSLTANQGPDVWTIPNDWVYRHKDKLVAYKAPEKVDKDDELGAVNVDKYFVPTAIDSVKFDDKIYGLTPAVDTLRIFYNKTLLEQSMESFKSQTYKNNKDYYNKINKIIDKGPLFWDDIVELNIALRQGGQGDISRPFIALGTGNNIAVGNDILYALLLQNKSDIFSEDQKTAIFNLPTTKATGESVTPAVGALDFYTAFADSSSSNFAWKTGFGLDTEAFENGQVTMVFNYLSYDEYLKSRYPSLKYGYYPLPQILSSSNQDITDYARFNAMTVPKINKNSTVAWNFVKYVSTLGQKDYTSATKRTGSATKKDDEVVVTDRQSGKPDQFQKFTAKTLTHKSRFPDSFNSALKQAIADVNNKALSSQATLDIAANTITQLLRVEGY